MHTCGNVMSVYIKCDRETLTTVIGVITWFDLPLSSPGSHLTSTSTVCCRGIGRISTHGKYGGILLHCVYVHVHVLSTCINSKGD